MRIKLFSGFVKEELNPKVSRKLPSNVQNVELEFILALTAPTAAKIWPMIFPEPARKCRKVWIKKEAVQDSIFAGIKFDQNFSNQFLFTTKELNRLTDNLGKAFFMERKDYVK
jgi:hypothetical protein